MPVVLVDEAEYFDHIVRVKGNGSSSSPSYSVGSGYENEHHGVISRLVNERKTFETHSLHRISRIVTELTEQKHRIAQSAQRRVSIEREIHDARVVFNMQTIAMESRIANILNSFDSNLNQIFRRIQNLVSEPVKSLVCKSRDL